MRRRTLFFALASPPIIFGLLRLPPRQVICETTEHTYCPAPVETLVATLKKASFLRSPGQFLEIERKSRELMPELATMRFRRSLLWTISATVEISPAAFPALVENQSYLVRANGLVESTEPSTQPAIIFASPEAWLNADRSRITNLRSEDVQLLGELHRQFSNFSPRITKFVFISPQETKLYFDGKNPAIVRSDDENWLPQQLAALQAFFRSSTIADTYQEIDARFTDLVIR